MKRIAFVIACEGEPPKLPEGAPPSVAPEPAPTAEQAPVASATPPPSTVPLVAPTCCACNCAGGDAGAPTALADGSAPNGATPDGGATVVVATVKGTVMGTVTTTPASSAANAVIYLEDGPIEPTAKMGATIDNHQMTFAPFVAVIPTGGHVAFHNSDPFPHNVFSPDHEKFNLGNIAQGTSAVRTFKKPGAYTLLCNLHPGMIGYVLVSPSSYFAKADSKGHFTIKDVPAGSYQLTAWAPRQQPVTQPVRVDAAEATVNFELHR